MKNRLDILLVEHGHCESRSQARSLIMEGKVRVNGKTVDKAGEAVREDAEIEVVRPSPYVSRGGIKLEGALNRFADLRVVDRIALDIGASTGGFTDCLLQRGVKKVYAVDVGYGQLAWKLRSDSRVVSHERTNFRELETGFFPEFIDLVVADVSFISLDKILLPLKNHVKMDATDCVLLIKPQFEVGRDKVGDGVIRDSKIRTEAIEGLIAFAVDCGYRFIDGIDSSLPGPKGNVEYLAWFKI